MAAALPLTVSTTGRLLFLSCFMKSPERRRNVVSDWMSLVMSSMEDSFWKVAPFKVLPCAARAGQGRKGSGPAAGLAAFVLLIYVILKIRNVYHPSSTSHWISGQPRVYRCRFWTAQRQRRGQEAA